MAPHLGKLVQEDFDVIDEYVRKKKEGQERQVSSYYQTQYISLKKVVVDNSEATKRPIVYYHNSKNVGAKREGGVIDSNEAAKKYGGVLLVEFPQRKPSVWF